LRPEFPSYHQWLPAMMAVEKQNLAPEAWFELFIRTDVLIRGYLDIESFKEPRRASNCAEAIFALPRGERKSAAFFYLRSMMFGENIPARELSTTIQTILLRSYMTGEES